MFRGKLFHSVGAAAAKDLLPKYSNRLQNSLSFKDASGGMAYLTQMSLLKKKNAAFISIRSYNNWNDISIKTTKQCNTDLL